MDFLLRTIFGGVALENHIWRRREIENYIVSRDILLRYARRSDSDDLVGRAEKMQREDAMNAALEEIEGALRSLGKDPWSHDTKMSDELLTPLFKRYYARLGLSNRMSKTDFHIIADVLSAADLDAEVLTVLDAIYRAVKT